jgi:hypothetical protein
MLIGTQQIKTVVIDSLNGYQAAMPEENSLMHELLQYLNRQGAMTFMTVAQHGLIGRGAVKCCQDRVGTDDARATSWAGVRPSRCCLLCGEQLPTWPKNPVTRQVREFSRHGGASQFWGNSTDHFSCTGQDRGRQSHGQGLAR